MKGSIIKIPIKDNFFGYGRIVDKNLLAVYDLVSDKEKETEEVLKSRVLFINNVNYDVGLKKYNWKIIGKRELEDVFVVKPTFFVQDIIEPDKYFLVRPPYSSMIPAKREDCLGLERAMISYPEHIQDRLEAYFFGISPRWKESYPLDWGNG